MSRYARACAYVCVCVCVLITRSLLCIFQAKPLVITRFAFVDATFALRIVARIALTENLQRRIMSDKAIPNDSLDSGEAVGASEHAHERVVVVVVVVVVLVAVHRFQSSRIDGTAPFTNPRKHKPRSLENI